MNCKKCDRRLYKNSKGGVHARCTPNKCIQCGKIKKTSIGQRCSSCHSSYVSKGKVVSKETRVKISNSRMGKKASKETRMKMSESHMGSKNAMYGKSPVKGAGRGKRTYYKGICFRSTYESKVAKWLDDNNYEWCYEKYRIYFEERTYLPDFFIYQNNKLLSIIEVKGYLSLEQKHFLDNVKKNIYVDFEIWNKEVLENKGIL